MGAWHRAWIAALFVLAPYVGIASDLDAPPPQEDPAATRALPTIATRPTTRPQPLSPAPEITSFSPRTEIIAGGSITLYGRNLRPSDLVARLGALRPVTLKILRSTSTAIRVLVPESAVTRGGALTVQYPGSQVATLSENFRVHPRPKFSNLVFHQGPGIGAATEMEISIANFSGLEGSKLTWWSNCWSNGRGDSHMPANGGTPKIRLSVRLGLNDPALGPTEELTALSGRRCSLDVSIGHMRERVATGLSFQLPAVARYTIENTWELQGYSTPSGKNFKASVSGLPGACGPLSLGTAGSYPIGVVSFENDISFQLRNGLINLSCEFTTSPRLRVKDGWQITEVDWVTTSSPDYRCRADIEYVEFAPGLWGYRPPLNPEYLDRIKTVAACIVDTQDRARNSHLFRAVLRKIVLVGPPGQSWRAAFR